jgi:hypothetical protein
MVFFSVLSRPFPGPSSQHDGWRSGCWYLPQYPGTVPVPTFTDTDTISATEHGSVADPDPQTNAKFFAYKFSKVHLHHFQG